MGHSYGTLLRDTLVRHSCGTLIRDTLVGHSIWDTLVGHTLRGCKTSASYETSSKSHTSSLQNERFVRNFLKNSHVKACKTSVSYETSCKSQAETPIGAHTSRSPAMQFRDSSPSKQHPRTRQSQCDSDSHIHHNSQPRDCLRLPQIFPRPHV